MRGLYLYRQRVPKTIGIACRLFSSQSGNGNGSGSGDRSSQVKGSTESFFRDAKDKSSSETKKPWSKLLNQTPQPKYSTKENENQQSSSRGQTQRKAKRREQTDEYSLSDEEDDEVTANAKEIWRETEEFWNVDHPDEPDSETFTPHLEFDDSPALEQGIDLYEDPTPEKIKTVKINLSNDEVPEEEIDLDVKDSKKGSFNKPSFDYSTKRSGGRRKEEDDFADSFEANPLEADEVASERDNGAYLKDEYPEELGVLNIMDNVTAMAREGKTYDYSGVSEFDQFVGNILTESVKTQEGVVWGSMELGTQKRERIRIPHPRTTRQLARAITPQIRSAPPGSFGYKLASEAWSVLSKNPYWSQKDKIEGCNFIAKEVESIVNPKYWNLSPEEIELMISTDPELKKEDFDSVERNLSSDFWSKDMVDSEIAFDFSFRPGPDLIEQEQLEDQKRLEESQRAMELISKQQTTDWTVQAVVDEDDLFK